MKHYERFVTEQFGASEFIFHEILSPDIHIDIIVVPPTDERPFYQLITMGMGAYKMKAPRGACGLERAELIMRLPATWNIRSRKPEDFWPFRQLKMAARIPIGFDTWVGFGHTFAGADPPEPFAANTQLCSTVLLTGLNEWNKPVEARIRGLGKINFYFVFPLYKEELEFTFSHDVADLIERFDVADTNPVINIARKNYGL